MNTKETRLIYPLIYTNEKQCHKYCTRLSNVLKLPRSLGKKTLKANNGRNLALEIKLFESKCIIPLNKFLNRNENKKPYHGLM